MEARGSTDSRVPRYKPVNPSSMSDTEAIDWSIFRMDTCRAPQSVSKDAAVYWLEARRFGVISISWASAPISKLDELG